MKPVSIAVLTLFCIGLPISLVIVGTNQRFLPEMQLAVLWLRTAAGTFIAVVAALAILVRCLNGKQMNDLMALVIALFAGLAVVSGDWALTTPLGVVVVGLLVREILELFWGKPNAKREVH